MKTTQSIVHAFRLMKDIINASPTRILFELIDVFAEVVNSIVVRTILVKFILDFVIYERYREAIAWICLAAMTDLACSMYQNWMNHYYRNKNNIRLHRYFHENLYRAAVEVDVCYYDNPEYYNKFILAAKNSDVIASQFIDSFRSALVTIAEIILSGGLIVFKLGYLLYIIVPASLLYGVCASKNAHEKVKMVTDKVIFDKRREYAKRIFFMKEYALDVRMTKVSDLLFKMLSSSKQETIRKINPYVKKRCHLFMISGFLFNFQYLSIILFLTWRALEIKDITVGDFSMLLSAALILGNNLRFFGNTIADMSEQGLFSDKYYEFLRIVDDTRNGRRESAIPGKFEKLEAENVVFQYDKNQPTVFEDISLRIQEGQKVAVVGPNGAGKSTLVNLILSLYNPQKGMMKYNGYDIQNFDEKAYKFCYSLVFQDVKVYPFTIAENILLHTVEKEDEITYVWDLLKQVELDKKVSGLPRGIHTVVTKEFDSSGIVLSGGECQKLILARAIAQNAQFFIMDEPSSALDPKMELHLNQMLKGILKDKTLLLISHRLSTIVGADYIYLLCDGKVEEEGTHQELMDKDGHYAQIYKTQSELYAME